MRRHEPDDRRRGALKLRSVARDVVALGWGAPLRAAYEASKRLGGHRAVFGRLARQDVGAHDRRATIDWPTEVPPAAIDRVERAAVAVANGTIRLFGRDCDLGSPPMWHSMVSTPGTWPAAPWWTIDIRGGKHAPDVKWVWELGRCHHVVVLARAAHFGRAHDAKPLADQVRSWLTHNPPERGIHWYANLQLALNAITFSEVLDRSGDALEPHLTAGLRAALWNSGQHLMADLPYTLSTMRNNHLLGDAL